MADGVARVDIRHLGREVAGAGGGAVPPLRPLVVAVHLGGTPGLGVAVYGGAGRVLADQRAIGFREVVEEGKDTVTAVVTLGGCGVVR